MVVSLKEQEISCSMLLADRKWIVYTCIPKHIRKFERLGWAIARVEGEARVYEVPERCISFRSSTPRKASKTAFKARS